jgi:hypothetical protein
MTLAARSDTQTIRPAIIRIAVAFGLSIAAAAPAAAACNPLEFLFGGCRETQSFREPVYYPPTRAERASDVRHVAKRKAATAPRAQAAGGVTGKQKPLAANPGAPVGSLALFVQDPTLRSGDIVVTKSGFMVYNRGGAFEPISRKNGQLSQLEKVSMEAIKAAATQSAPASGPKAAVEKKELPVAPQASRTVQPHYSWVGIRREASLDRGRSVSRIAAN